MSLWKRLKAWWPLRWKSTVTKLSDTILARQERIEALEGDLVNMKWERDDAVEKKKVVEIRSASMQSSLERIIRDSGWQPDRDLVTRLYPGEQRWQAFISEPCFRVMPPDVIHPRRSIDGPMMELLIRVGMTPETPPEFVVRQIEAKVREAILIQWQEQSALLRENR